MNPAHFEDDLALLRVTLEKCGVEVRSERCGGEGGMVRIGDRLAVFVPTDCPKTRILHIYCAAIKKLIGAHDSLHVPPRIRQLLGEEDWSD